MSVSYDAENTKQIAYATQGHHSKKTFHPNQPGIEPWMRETLLAIQRSLNALAETQVEIARQVERNTARIERIERFLQANSGRSNS